MKRTRFLFCLLLLVSSVTAQSSKQRFAQSMQDFGNASSALALSLYQNQSRVSSILYSNFDIAIPPFSDSQMALCFTYGYYVDTYKHFLIKGNAVDEKTFMNELGFSGYVYDLNRIEKQANFWNIAMITTGIATLVLFPIAIAVNDWSFSSPVAGAAMGSLISLTISMGGGLVTLASVPSFPPFEMVANSANRKNREIIKNYSE